MKHLWPSYNETPKEIMEGLPAGKSIELHFTGTDPGSQNSATVDKGGKIQEISEGNNTRTTSLPRHLRYVEIAKENITLQKVSGTLSEQVESSNCYYQR